MSIPVIALSDVDVTQTKKLRDRLRELAAEEERVRDEQQELRFQLIELLHSASRIPMPDIAVETTTKKVPHLSEDGKYVVVTTERNK